MNSRYSPGVSHAYLINVLIFTGSLKEREDFQDCEYERWIAHKRWKRCDEAIKIFRRDVAGLFDTMSAQYDQSKEFRRQMGWKSLLRGFGIQVIDRIPYNLPSVLSNLEEGSYLEMNLFCNSFHARAQSGVHIETVVSKVRDQRRRQSRGRAQVFDIMQRQYEYDLA